MRRFSHLAILASLLSLGANTAIAAVHVRVAVDPQIIPQCSRAHFFFSLGNDGTEPIGVRVGISLLHDGQVVAGPFLLSTRLAAGGHRTHEFDFFMPPLVPTGHYGFAARAEGTDGSTDESAALFEVVQGTCLPPRTSMSPTDALMRDILQGLGSGTTGTALQPWDAVKELYR